MYITYSDVELYLGVTLTGPQQAQVTALIGQIQGYVERYCNRKWGMASQTEKFDGDTKIFIPKYPPITSITTVKVDGVIIPATEYYNYETYIKLETNAGSGFKNVEITYVPNTTIPNDIKMVLVQWVSEQYLEAQNLSTTGGTTPESITVGPVSVNYGSGSSTGKGDAGEVDGVPDLYANILDLYRLEPVL